MIPILSLNKQSLRMGIIINGSDLCSSTSGLPLRSLKLLSRARAAAAAAAAAATALHAQLVTFGPKDYCRKGGQMWKLKAAFTK
jgi:hypothetical protein